MSCSRVNRVLAWGCSIAALLSVDALATPAAAQVERAKALYADLQYEKCLELTALAAKTALEPAARAELFVTQGLCELQLRRTRAAQLSFERALRELPSAVLPRLAPPTARELFAAVKADLERPPPEPGPAAPAAAPPLDQTPAPVQAPDAPLAPEPPSVAPAVVEPAPRAEPALHVEVVPAPSPSLYSPWPARVALGALAVVAAGVSAGLLGAAHGMAAQHNAEPFWMTRQELGARANSLQTASAVSLAVALAVLAAGAAHELWFRW